MFDPDLQFDADYWRELYMEQVFPWLRDNGPSIGERAMQGDKDAENIILRVSRFQVDWHPENYRLLVAQLKAYQKKMLN